MIHTDDTPLLQITLQTILGGIETSLAEYMPPGPHQDYFLWAISPQNPYSQAFYKDSGITRLVDLTLKLTEGLFEPDEWQQMLKHCAEIYAFLVYKTITDNLLAGLAGRTDKDANQKARSELLIQFHNSAAAALNGHTRPAIDLLEPLRPMAQEVDQITQPLSRPLYVKLAEAYAQHHPDFSPTNLQYAYWPFLVASVESARAMLANIEPAELQALARTSLQQHYRAMNIFLLERSQSYHQMIWLGAHSVMAVPLLAYAIAFIGTTFEDQVDFQQVISNGTLEKNLYHAALLVRLLNDLGTELLTQTHEDRKTLFQNLKYWATSQSPRAALIECFEPPAGEFRQLAWLRKAAVNGEYNLALYGMDLHQPALAALDFLEERIAYYTDLYNTTYLDFSVGIHHLNCCLRDSRVARLITRYVKFHEHLYSIIS